MEDTFSFLKERDCISVRGIKHVVFGSDRSSRSHYVCSSVRSVQTCLELSFFIILAQIFKLSVRNESAVSEHSESTQRALREHSESTQRALREHSESTQRALREHLESTQRALREHSESTQRALKSESYRWNQQVLRLVQVEVVHKYS